MKRLLGKYGSIVLGSLYGLIMRLIFGVAFSNINFHFADLFSVTFVWIVPIIIGITPMLFATQKQLSSNFYRIGSPIMSVFLFFLFCFWSGKEDIICIVVISIPFLLGAALGGSITANFIRNYRQRKGIIYSVFLVPLLFGLIEDQVPTPSKIYKIQNSVFISASPSQVWENVVRVKEIKEGEYHKGFFNFAGIPRPLYAELDKDTIGATRTGHFEGGLIFKERIMQWDPKNRVSFDIKVVPTSIRKTIFDQHVLKGEHFKFLNATYAMKQIDNGTTLLTLSSSYQLDTKINFYGSFWANWLLADFQERLLAVIKDRCNK